MLSVQTYTDIDLVPTAADDFLEQDSNKIYQNVGYVWLQDFDLVRFAGAE
jgi:hypothetical protein